MANLLTLQDTLETFNKLLMLRVCQLDCQCGKQLVLLVIATQIVDFMFSGADFTIFLFKYNKRNF